VNLPGYGSIVHGRMSHGGPFYPRQYVPPGGEPSLDASPLTDEQVATLRERARARQVLDLDIGDNLSGATTVRGYLLAKLWTEADDFKGKRPFGSSVKVTPRPPTYYNGKTGMQPFDVIDEFGLDFYEGNVVKYIVRWRKKNGLEDLRKARTYLSRIIARAEAEQAREQGGEG
jgi:Protein of unknwon function (DUF3310)